jgi:drug/metabolite transporter (DMT)-like permease
MTPGISFALGAMVCFGLSDLVYKRAAGAGVPAHQLMMVQSWLYGTLVVIYGLITHTLVFNLASLWGVLAGVFAYTGFYNFARSLAGGSVSVNAPIFRLSFTLTAALAVLFLGESLGWLKLAGLASALSAVWLLLGSAQGLGPMDAKKRASLIRVLIATVAVGISHLIYKLGLLNGGTPTGMLAAQAALVMTLSAAMAWRIDGRIGFSRVTAAHASVTAVLLTAAFIFLFEGLARGEASRLVPIAQMGFVVTATVGFVFLREAYTARKGIGLAFALAALGALAYA